MRRRIIISLGVLLALCLLGDIVAISYLTRITGQLQRLADSHRVQSMRATLARPGAFSILPFSTPACTAFPTTICSSGFRTSTVTWPRTRC